MEETLPSKKNPAVHNHDATEKNFFDSEHKLSLLLPMEENSVDWEETVRRDGWTPLQHRIFNKVLIIFTIDLIQFSKILISTIFNRLSNCLLLITWQG